MHDPAKSPVRENWKNYKRPQMCSFLNESPNSKLGEAQVWEQSYIYL